MATYLDRILREHRSTAACDSRSVSELRAAADAGPSARGFKAQLRSVSGAGRLAVIAEIKRRSPSLGDIAPRIDPADVARAYTAGGAACVSVLTDSSFFGGSAGDLAAARAATSLPVLRKDFTVCAADVYDARAMGADAVLLIAAALSDAELGAFHDLTEALGMDALVEVHDLDELARALAVGASLIGVNQRDLVTFSVDTTRAVRVAAEIPDGVVRVAESGIDGPAAASRLADAGYDAILVGETPMRAEDRAAAVSELGARGARL